MHRSRGLEDKCFDEVTMSHPIMEEGMLFTDVGQFREGMKNLIIREGRKVQRKKNGREKVSASVWGQVVNGIYMLERSLERRHLS